MKINSNIALDWELGFLRCLGDKDISSFVCLIRFCLFRPTNDKLALDFILEFLDIATESIIMEFFLVLLGLSMLK